MKRRTIILAIIAILAIAAYYSPNILAQFNSNPTGPNNQSTEDKLTKQQVDQLLASKETKLKITAPVKDAKVAQQFTVTGEARLPGQTVRTLVRGGNKVLARGTTTLNANTLDWTKFTLDIKLRQPYKGQASLESYWLSPKTGQRTDIIKIPISIQ